MHSMFSLIFSTFEDEIRSYQQITLLVLKVRQLKNVIRREPRGYVQYVIEPLAPNHSDTSAIQ